MKDEIWRFKCVVCGCLCNEALVLTEGTFCIDCNLILIQEVFRKFKKEYTGGTK